ncbi:MAG: alpha/beta fold hydrolase [Gammaproteobacteria bacterium]
MAKDTYQLIQDLHLRKPAILGISMGGMIAQQLAVLQPDKIGHLILINTAIAGKNTVHPSPEVEATLLNMPESKLGRYQVALKLFFPPDWRVRMAYALAFDRFQPLHYQEIDAAKVIPKQRQLILGWLQDDKTASKINKLSVPTLILNGEADIVIPPVNSVILLRAIPHAQLYRWREGGHALNYQFPNQLALTIHHFMTDTA